MKFLLQNLAISKSHMDPKKKKKKKFRCIGKVNVSKLNKFNILFYF